jgi:hypothetical protein
LLVVYTARGVVVVLKHTTSPACGRLLDIIWSRMLIWFRVRDANCNVSVDLLIEPQDAQAVVRKNISRAPHPTAANTKSLKIESLEAPGNIE